MKKIDDTNILVISLFISVWLFFIVCQSLIKKKITSCSVYPFFFQVLWSSFQTLPWTHSWLDCLSPLQLILLAFALFVCLKHFLLLPHFSHLGKVVFCRKYPVFPSSTLLSCHWRYMLWGFPPWELCESFSCRSLYRQYCLLPGPAFCRGYWSLIGRTGLQGDCQRSCGSWPHCSGA